MPKYEVIVIGKGKNLYLTNELAKERLAYFKSLGYEAYKFPAGKIPDVYKGKQLHLDKYREIGDSIVHEQHQKHIRELLIV